MSPVLARLTLLFSYFMLHLNYFSSLSAFPISVSPRSLPNSLISFLPPTSLTHQFFPPLSFSRLLLISFLTSKTSPPYSFPYLMLILLLVFPSVSHFLLSFLPFFYPFSLSPTFIFHSPFLLLSGFLLLSLTHSQLDKILNAHMLLPEMEILLVLIYRVSHNR